MGIFLLNEEPVFPSADYAEKDGLLAIEGDLSPERLLAAYSQGIFPWYEEGSPILWWSPNPRMLLFTGDFKVKKSLRNTLNKNLFTVRFDTNFEEVIRACARIPRKDQDGTWITEEMIDAYCKLHQMGYAHSAETYYEENLVGGLYGISLGGAFFGESMFYKMSNASKIALYYLIEKIRAWGFDFIDVQQETDHLKSLGAKAIPRKDFLKRLKESMKRQTRKGNWND